MKLEYELIEFGDYILFRVEEQNIRKFVDYEASNGIQISSSGKPEISPNKIFLRGSYKDEDRCLATIHKDMAGYYIEDYRDALEEFKNPHRELIKAYKNGAVIETFGTKGEWVVSEVPKWFEDRQYRVKEFNIYDHNLYGTWFTTKDNKKIRVVWFDGLSTYLCVEATCDVKYESFWYSFGELKEIINGVCDE